MSNRDAIEGSCMSLNKTIRKIKHFMEDSGKRPQDVKLRQFLYEKLADFGADWYKRGFQRGHKQSYKQYKKTGGLSPILRYEKEKELFTDQMRLVRVVSQIKRKNRIV